MITRITGFLNKVLEDRVRVQAGPLEYELLVSDVTRHSLESRVGQEVSLHTRHYLEAGAMQSAIHPRLIGFESETELEFFDLFCTVDKIGVRKALKAMTRPVKELAALIQSGDTRLLSKLPGIGGATAEKIVATLQKKVIPFTSDYAGGVGPVIDPILNELSNTLIRLGLSQYEARLRVDALIATGLRFGTIEEALQASYRITT